MTKPTADLDYLEMGVHSGLARFGILRNPPGEYELPALSPGIRTGTDAEAVLKTIRGGVRVEIISPYLSCGRTLPRAIQNELFRPESRLVSRHPFVLPDPESEAFSFNCTARTRFAKVPDTPITVRNLMKCGLSPGKANPEVYLHWQQHRKAYGFATLQEWLRSRYADVGSRLFLAVGPIVRSSETRVRQVFDIEKTILMDEVDTPSFQLFGVHFLLHAELFSLREEAKRALSVFYEELATLLGAHSVPRLLVSFKVHDASNDLQDSQVGSARRRALSEFVSEVCERVRRFGGAVAGHNFGNLGLGILDSGADVASFRVSGPTKIEAPSQRPKGLARPTPMLFNHGTLSDEPVSKLLPLWRSKKAFPTPTGVEPLPYWNFESFQEQVIYASHVRCAALVELGREYRVAGLDAKVPLSEALRSLVLRSEVRQQLLDLSPSLGGI